LGKVTMQDIADELGITKTTVYRAFNNKDNVKPELRKKIMDLAGQYGYKPNKLAKSLSRSNVIKIGVINKKDPQYFWGVVKRGSSTRRTNSRTMGLKSSTPS
jgi:LacI family transcriptional regulator